MSVLETLGSADATAQGTRKRWQQGAGEANLFTYKGPSAAVETLYNSFKQAALIDPSFVVLDYDPGKGLGTLIVEKADPNALLGTTTAGGITKVYELFANEFVKRAEQAPYFDDLTVAQIVRAYKAYDQGVEDASTAPYAFTGKQLALWKMISKAAGNPEFMDCGYVLRETKIVSGSTAVAQEFGNTNHVEDPPVAASTHRIITNLNFGDWEWLRKAPLVRQISRVKWHVQTEWWAAEAWSAALYGGTGDP